MVAVLAAVPGADVTCIEVEAPDVAKRFRAAQYAWINIPAVSTNEFHPFTINVRGDRVVCLCKTMHPIADKKSCGCQRRCVPGGGTTWTERLSALASSAPDDHGLGALGTQIIGPFAGLHDVDFNTSPLVLVAGGIGITPVISVYERALFLGVDDITLVWSIRSTALLELPVVRDILESTALSAGEGTIDVRIHVTRGEVSDPVAERLQELPHITLCKGRPALPEIIAGVVSRAVVSDSAAPLVPGGLPEGMGFGFACGPMPLQTELASLCKKAKFDRVHTETFEF